MSGEDLAPGEIVHRLARQPFPEGSAGCAFCGAAGDAEAHDADCIWRLAREWDETVSATMRAAGADLCPHCQQPLTSH